MNYVESNRHRYLSGQETSFDVKVQKTPLQAIFGYIQTESKVQFLSDNPIELKSKTIDFLLGIQSFELINQEKVKNIFYYIIEEPINQQKEAVLAGNAIKLFSVYTNLLQQERAVEAFLFGVADDPNILTSIADQYVKGSGVKKNDELAIYWYYMAYHNRQIDACWKLGICYRDGIGVVKDLKIAKIFFELAAQKNNADACYHLANLYKKGLGVEISLFKSYDLYYQAAIQAHKSAQFEFGKLCFTGIQQDGKSLHPNYEIGLFWIKSAADLGDVESLIWMGNYFANQKQLELNKEIAFEYYKRALDAENNQDRWSNDVEKLDVSLNPKRFVGFSLMFGQGVTKNIDLAIFYLDQAAREEDHLAKLYVALCYLSFGKNEMLQKKASNYLNSCSKEKLNFRVSRLKILFAGLKLDENEIPKLILLKLYSLCNP